MMNICQPGGSAAFVTGGEKWTAEDFPAGDGSGPTDFSIFDNSFQIL